MSSKQIKRQHKIRVRFKMAPFIKPIILTLLLFIHILIIKELSEQSLKLLNIPKCIDYE